MLSIAKLRVGQEAYHLSGVQTPTWPHRRSHSELVARRAELDAILDTDPGSALANSIETDERWIRLAIGRLAPQWATELDAEATDLLHDIADNRSRSRASGIQPIADGPVSNETGVERDDLVARLDRTGNGRTRHVQPLVQPVDLP